MCIPALPISRFHTRPNLLIWQYEVAYIPKKPFFFFVLKEYKMIKDRAICRCWAGGRGHQLRAKTF